MALHHSWTAAVAAAFLTIGLVAPSTASADSGSTPGPASTDTTSTAGRVQDIIRAQTGQPAVALPSSGEPAALQAISGPNETHPFVRLMSRSCR